MEISNKRIKELIDSEAKLHALEGGGVDNWEGYENSLEQYFKEHDFNEELEEGINGILEVLGEGVIEPAGTGCGYGFNERAPEQADALIRVLVKKLAAL